MAAMTGDGCGEAIPRIPLVQWYLVILMNGSKQKRMRSVVKALARAGYILRPTDLGWEVEKAKPGILALQRAVLKRLAARRSRSI